MGGLPLCCSTEETCIKIHKHSKMISPFDVVLP